MLALAIISTIILALIIVLFTYVIGGEEGGTSIVAYSMIVIPLFFCIASIWILYMN